MSDTPTTPPKPTPEVDKTGKKPELTDAYAQSLLHSVNMEYAQKQANKPVQKHFVSKKVLIYIAVSLVLTIIAAVAAGHMSKSKNNNSDNSSQQLINSGVNAGNPNYY